MLPLQSRNICKTGFLGALRLQNKSKPNFKAGVMGFQSDILLFWSEFISLCFCIAWFINILGIHEAPTKH